MTDSAGFPTIDELVSVQKWENLGEIKACDKFYHSRPKEVPLGALGCYSEDKILSATQISGKLVIDGRARTRFGPAASGQGKPDRSFTAPHRAAGKTRAVASNDGPLIFKTIGWTMSIGYREKGPFDRRVSQRHAAMHTDHTQINQAIPDSPKSQGTNGMPPDRSGKTPRIFLFGVLLVTGISWGATIPLAKVAVSTGHAPLGITFWEQTIVAVVLGILLVARSVIFRRRLNIPLDRAALTYYLVIAALGAVLPNLFSYWAMAQLPAGIMAIIVASVPMFAMTIAIAASVESYAPLRVLGVCLGCVSVVLLIAPNTSLPDAGKAVFVLVGLVAPFCYGLEGNYIARFTPPSVDPVGTLFCAAIIGAAVSAPLAVAFGAWIQLPGTLAAPEIAIVGMSIFHAAAYAIYIWLVGQAGPVFSSQVAYIVTLSAMFLSAIFLSEAYSPYTIASVALMLVGLMLVQPPVRSRSIVQGRHQQ